MYAVHKDASSAMVYPNKVIKDEVVQKREPTLEDLILDMDFI